MKCQNRITLSAVIALVACATACSQGNEPTATTATPDNLIYGNDVYLNQRIDVPESTEEVSRYLPEAVKELVSE